MKLRMTLLRRVSLVIMMLGLLAVLVLPSVTAQTNGSRECRLFSAESNGLVLVDVPDNAVPGGAVICRFIAREGRFIADRAEIGNQDVFNAGVGTAIEVFSVTGLRSIRQFDVPVRVCIRGGGGLTFLDSTDSRRVPRGLVTFTSGDYLCADIDRAGTVVQTGVALPQLTGGTPVPGATPGAPVVSAPLAPGTARTLTGCRVTTRAILNLRAEPSTTASIITTVPWNLTLQATDFTEGWYRVVYESGQGWLSARFLNTQGSCS